jgi:hypothetical protein
MSSKIYRIRMEKALRNHPDYLKNLSVTGVDIGRFSLKSAISALRKREKNPVREEEERGVV